MAKPIFIVGIPNIQSEEQMSNITKSLEQRMTDYHVLVYLIETETPTFECFYEKDFDEVKFEELKEIILNNLK